MRTIYLDLYILHICKFVPEFKNNTMHKGKTLAAAIKALGLKKNAIAKELKISRPTLDTRLRDGLFQPTQAPTVLEIINHYKQVKIKKCKKQSQ